MGQIIVAKLLNAATATGAGSSCDKPRGSCTYHIIGSTTAGAGAATVTLEVSNDETDNFLVIKTFNLVLGTSIVGDGFEVTASWQKIRANVTAISGTGASVTVYQGF